MNQFGMSYYMSYSMSLYNTKILIILMNNYTSTIGIFIYDMSDFGSKSQKNKSYYTTKNISETIRNHSRILIDMIFCNSKYKNDYLKFLFDSHCIKSDFNFCFFAKHQKSSSLTYF
jgi:hypothetical protein